MWENRDRGERDTGKVETAAVEILDDNRRDV